MTRTKGPAKTIGILGGMGPSASADFYRKLVDIAQREYGAEQDTDFPAMHLYNLPLSGFDETGFSDPDTVREQLTRAVSVLERAGSDFIVIACNTVHAFHADMQKAVRVPIVSIIDAVVDEAKKDSFGTVCLLSSESTRKYKLYENAFMRSGIDVIVTTDAEQRTLNTVIHRVMSGLQNEEDVELLRSIVRRHEQEGAEAIVLGCTELPLAIQQKDIHLPLLSSTGILAHAALARAYGGTG
jgi:aspartate racemase